MLLTMAEKRTVTPFGSGQVYDESYLLAATLHCPYSQMKSIGLFFFNT